jgi:hypothetical protein
MTGTRRAELHPWIPMIDIRIEDGSADDLTKSIMEEIAEDTREQLGEMRCPTHGQLPVIIIRGEDPEEIEVEIEACCRKFEEAFDARLDEIE